MDEPCFSTFQWLRFWGGGQLLAPVPRRLATDYSLNIFGVAFFIFQTFVYLDQYSNTLAK
jgi:hypothetical protein